MRRILVPVVVLLMVLASGWLALGGEAPRPVETAAASVVRANSRAVEGGRREAAPERGATAQERRAAARSEREALRRRIVDALERRAAAPGRAAETAASDREAPGGGTGRRSGRAAAEEVPAPGTVVDRTGEHGYLMKVTNEELMPLAAECEALAREARPDLAGMLVLDFEILADEEIGGVVEAVVPGQLNEVEDETLLECMRESILAVTLPAPPQGGRDAVSLSMPMEPDPQP